MNATARPAILALNAGSSSIKFALFEGLDPVERARGQVESIGDAPQLHATATDGRVLAERRLDAAEVADHQAALAAILGLLAAHFAELDIVAVGHRIVHGGVAYAAPARLDAAAIADLKALGSFAPLHQPHNMAGVEAAMAAFPSAIQVGCFDTAFHRGHPWVADTYALPAEFYAEGVRRYGFHGLSYEFVSGRLAEIAPDIAAGRVVIAHLGNGASMCAVLAGRSIDSTMGFSAAEGLPMGTRAGQIDPGVLLHLIDHKAMSSADLTDLLYRKSGLKGLSGLSHDMRTLEAAGTPAAEAALDYFAYRVRRELGGLAAALSGLDALVFTGGIGEHAWRFRARVADGLGWLGIRLDPGLNQASAGVISEADSPVRVLVIETNEELMIARHAAALIAPAA